MPRDGKGKRRYTRTTANRVLADVLVRIHGINRDDRYAFRVKAVRLFGSMLTNATDVGDIDLAIQLEFRQGWVDPHRGGGDRYRPWREVYAAIKARSPLVSLHDWCEPETLGTPSQRIWPPSDQA
jgi:hypothetical protein